MSHRCGLIPSNGLEAKCRGPHVYILGPYTSPRTPIHASAYMFIHVSMQMPLYLACTWVYICLHMSTGICQSIHTSAHMVSSMLLHAGHADGTQSMYCGCLRVGPVGWVGLGLEWGLFTSKLSCRNIVVWRIGHSTGAALEHNGKTLAAAAGSAHCSRLDLAAPPCLLGHTLRLVHVRFTTLRHVRAAFSAFGMSEPGVPTIDSSQRRGDITIDNIGRTIAPTTNRRVPIFLPGATPWAGGLASSAQHHRRVSGGGRWLTHDAEYVAWTKPCHTGRSMP